ncbi:3-hydroxyacyl-CoA dehydrogenase PaaH [Herbaspirillum lusitanum]|uniref:3-hydroxyacyl-CoA dehydrogenase PaaH n=1 Tax=Herbaspirillum lusitanum TaxID=213312 RepID=UPI00037193E9|nr:3-hydroxyacyl-CoA dehydrogenase PaaH [Herbaspirillum lusitanum]
MNNRKYPHALSRSALVAVIGSGTMGAGIAQVAAVAGHPVLLYDSREGAAGKAIGAICTNLDKLVSKDKLTPALAQAASQRISVAQSLEELHQADLVIEAIVEQLAAKHELFGKLEAIVSTRCILATNTSSLSITQIAAGLQHPERVVGMHFFNPVPLMALVEIISGLASDAAVAECVYDTALAWGKNPVHTKSTPGFIVNRVARPYYAEALRILNEQAAGPATIDAILREAGGFRMGPFELMDLIGHDVNFAVTQSVFHAYFTDPRFTPSLIQQELVNAGFLGRKSGRGFYRYGEAAGAPRPETERDYPKPTATPQLYGDHPLVEMIHTRYPGQVQRHPARPDQLLMKVNAACLCITDGRSATLRAWEHQEPDLVLVDLALDYADATRLALAKADQCRPQRYAEVAGVLQACGLDLSPMQDVPGMAVMRTVAMLANEAADTVNQGVCSAADADMAMQKGVNYPRGPLAWADAIGLDTVAEVLSHLAAAYGEDRYRVSPLIMRKTASKGQFHA